MPTYDYECQRCGTFEVVHSMHRPLKLCPTCMGKVTKIVTATQVIARDRFDWSDENNGRGRYIPQIAKHKGDPSAYYRSRSSLIDSAKRRGFTVTKGEEP